MLNLVVCIKQVPMVSELPWDKGTGTLRRDAADGMMNPTCKVALEAALDLKARHGARIIALTMGPPMAEEVLREAIALGADRGVLLTDRRMAGADTQVTSMCLARAIRRECPDVDLVLCGCHTSDSETAQVGPQLAEDLEIPGLANVERYRYEPHRLDLTRLSDHFLEQYEMALPGLITLSPHANVPRYLPLAGIETAFSDGVIIRHDAESLGLDADAVGVAASPTRILDVYSPTAKKQNLVLEGTPKKIVEEIFRRYGDRIVGAIGKDLTTESHEN